MWTCAFRSLRPRIPWSLLLSLLLLPMSPAVVQAASATEATTPDCAQSGLEPRPVAVRLTRTERWLVQATLHAPAGALPAIGCRVPLEFHIPEDARPYYAVWRDVEGRAVQADGTPDPAHPAPLPLRLWIHPDGILQYEVREAGVKATHAVLDLAVAWGATAAANDLVVLDILRDTLGLDLDLSQTGDALYWELQEMGVLLDDRGRAMWLDWYADHPSETYEICYDVCDILPMSGIRPPRVRTIWQLPSELGQLTALSQLALGGPLLTGTIPPELGQLVNLAELTLAGSRLTGTVPPELAQLTNLWKLELHSNRLTALPPELAQLGHLQKLELHSNRLTSLPPELAQLGHLRKLDVSDNRLTSLPAQLGQLTNLEELVLAGNQLTTLPSEIGQLTYLGILNVQDNQLTNLPSLAFLENLRFLDLSGNRLTTPPLGLPSLPVLQTVDLSDNLLTEVLPGSFSIPSTYPKQTIELDELGQISREFGKPLDWFLVSLNLSGNQLTTLPPDLSQLRLEILDLSDNQLTELPPELGQMRPPVYYNFNPPLFGLKLNLAGNRFTTLPDVLWQLGHLTDLNLSGNQIETLPDALYLLRHLTDLNLSGNQLETLPDVLWQLGHLTDLNLGGNQLETLPPRIGNLTELATLNLRDNQLTDLPQELGELSQLDTLDLSGNQLTALPAELKQISRLRHLNLSGNRLPDIPAGLDELSRLDSLDLSANQLTDLSISEAVLTKTSQWPRGLIQLDLSDNQLTALPLALVQFRLESLNLSHNQLTDFHLDQGQLRSLIELNLSHNQLTDLPMALVELQRLTNLNLSHNQFSEIPPVLSQLRPLLSLDLRGNPLTTCPLPLRWQIDRYIYPPDFKYYDLLDPWLLKLRPGTEPSDLPFLDLCLE